MCVCNPWSHRDPFGLFFIFALFTVFHTSLLTCVAFGNYALQQSGCLGDDRSADKCSPFGSSSNVYFDF